MRARLACIVLLGLWGCEANIIDCGDEGLYVAIGADDFCVYEGAGAPATCAARVPQRMPLGERVVCSSASTLPAALCDTLMVTGCAEPVGDSGMDAGVDAGTLDAGDAGVRRDAGQPRDADARRDGSLDGCWAVEALEAGDLASIVEPRWLVRRDDWLYVTSRGTFYRVGIDAIAGEAPVVEVLAERTGGDYFFLSSDHIYFSTGMLGVQRVPIDGGPVEDFAPPTEGLFTRAAGADATTVYWLEYGRDGGQLFRKAMAEPGGAAIRMTADVGSGEPLELAHHGSHVYWTWSDAAQAVRRVPDDGGGAPEDVFATAGRATQLELTPDGTVIVGTYISIPAHRFIYVDTPATAPVEIRDDGSANSTFAYTATYLYFFTGSHMHRVPLATPEQEPEALVDLPGIGSMSMAPDAEWLYVSWGGNSIDVPGRLARVRLCE